MARMGANRRAPLARLIVLPGLAALAVTTLRLVGELCHWSPRWFDSEGGGITPSGLSWVIGITWLALPFGVYFAVKLIARGERPANAGLAAAYSAGGVIVLGVGLRVIVPQVNADLVPRLLLIWAFAVVPALLLFKVWPGLWRVLLVYGFVSRMPVAVIMLLAMYGHWGTHYDYGGLPMPYSLWPSYFLLGFVPQLVFWVAFTILIGMLGGAITAMFYREPGTSKRDTALNASG